MQPGREPTRERISSRFLANSSWLLGDRVVRLAIGIAVNVVLARSFGPATFGVFTYATTLAALFLPVATLGLERIVVRELTRGEIANPQVLGSACGLKVLGGLLSWAFATIAAQAMTGNDSTGWVVAAMAAGNVFLAMDVVDWSFQSAERFKFIVLARSGAFIVGAAVKIALARAGAPLIWIAVAMAVEAALAAALLAVFYRSTGGEFRLWSFQWSTARTLLVLSAPLLVAEMAVWLFQKFDTIILQAFGGDAEVGIYGAAQRLGQAAYFAPVLVVQLLSPLMAKATDTVEALAITQRAMSWLVLAALGWSLTLFLGAGPLVLAVFGPEYALAGPVLAVMAWTNVFVFMGCAHSLYLINRGHQAVSLRLTWITAVVSIGLNLLLVPRWHAFGAAVAALMTYGATTLFGVTLYAESRPLLGVNLRALAAPLLLPWTKWRSPRS